MTTDTAIAFADSHLATHDYGGGRTTLLLYFRQKLAAAGKTSAKADAVQAWIDGIIFTAALSPEQLAAALTPPPFAFAEVVIECVDALQTT
jgi:hypothetical protein